MNFNCIIMKLSLREWRCDSQEEDSIGMYGDANPVHADAPRNCGDTAFASRFCLTFRSLFGTARGKRPAQCTCQGYSTNTLCMYLYVQPGFRCLFFCCWYVFFVFFFFVSMLFGTVAIQLAFQNAVLTGSANCSAERPRFTRSVSSFFIALFPLPL